MRISNFILGAICACLSAAASADDKVTKPCTVQSPKTGSFYDLRDLSLQPPEDPKNLKKGERVDSWKSSGYDYGANFTLNFCAPVLEKLDDVVGVSEKLYRNISAYYTSHGKTYSIGQESSDVTFRGRKLVLQYTNGSPCGTTTNKRADAHRKKSTLISFHCEKDPLASQAVTSFVGTDPDECAYFFEVRTQEACGGAEPVDTRDGLGPGGVFFVILLITVMVYFLGGIMYQRSVAHARGWRQLPNYSFWAGIGSFFKDMFIITTSSCARFLPSRRGYSSVSTNGYGDRGRSRPEDENRLIDQLDEEWDD